MMSFHRCTRWRLQGFSYTLAVPLIGLLAGCQSYTRAPLDLQAHRAAFAARSMDSEPVALFSDRLRDLGQHAPDEFDLRDGLSLAEAEVLALFYNADLRMQRLRAGVSEANFENAGLFEDPVFGFDGADIFSPSAPFEFGLTLGLTIPISGRLGAEKDRAGAALEAELRRIVDAEWRIRGDVRQAWVSWTAMHERTGLLGEVFGQVQRIGAVTDRLGEAGEISRVESRLFSIERSNREAQLNQAQLDERVALSKLFALMGIPDDAPLTLLPAFEAQQLTQIESPIDRIIESNTHLAVRRAEYQVAEETLRREIREQYPDIKIGGGYGSEGNDDRLLLGLSIPIPILNANRGGIAAARAERDVARAAAEASFENLIRGYRLALATLESVGLQRDRYESEIVPMLDDQFGEIERIAELGEVDTFLLLETVTRQFEAKSRLLDLRIIEAGASIGITQLLGPETPLKPAPIDDPSEKPALADAQGGEG